jgi:hypothetical protein
MWPRTFPSSGPLEMTCAYTSLLVASTNRVAVTANDGSAVVFPGYSKPRFHPAVPNPPPSAAGHWPARPAQRRTRHSSAPSGPPTRETWPAGARARAGPPERAVSGTAAKTTATTDTATRPSTATSPPKASNRMELAYRYANTSAAPPARPTNRTWIRRQRQAVRTPGSSPRRRCAAGVPHRLCKRRGLTMNHRPGDRPTRSPPHANGAYHRMQERHPESANLRAAAKQPAPAISHT